MKLELYLASSEDGKVYDISNIAQQIKVEEDIGGNAGRLSCVLQKDPNETLQISNGSIVSFKVDGKGFFFGYVFKIGTDADGNYKITCYDQLRYLKNSDVYTFQNMTASDIFAKICKDFNLKYEIKSPTNFIPNPYTFNNKSLYSIIKQGMDLASINDDKLYYIIDDYGVIKWSSFDKEKINLQLGDNAGVTSFTYEKSIDEDTYNQIKLYRENKEAGKIDQWLVKDSDNIKRWGILQLLKKANDNSNEAQIREQATNYLKVKNRETETLKFQAEGILECRAGKGIRFVLKRENIDRWMWIKSSSHTFTKYQHTMDLEVEV